MAASSKPPSVHSVGSEPVDLASATTPFSLARAVLARRNEYVQPRSTKVKIGTWNVAACPGTDKDLASWFVEGRGIDQNFATLDLNNSNNAVKPDGDEQDPDSVRLLGGEEVGLYVLGLQEVVDINLTKEYMTRAVYVDNSTREKWQVALEAAMPEGYKLIVAEQSFGLLLLIYASPELAPIISNVSTKTVNTGFANWLANKGAVTTRLMLGETTRLVFSNCHLTSGATSANMDRRCADVNQIVSKTQFDPVVVSGVEEEQGDTIGDEDFAFWFGDLNFRMDGLPGDDIRRLLTLHAKGEYDVTKPSAPIDGEGVIVMRNSESDDDTTTRSSIHSRDQSFDSETTLPDPDDFPEDPSQDPASLQATLDSLLPHDQLIKLMARHKIFHEGWREGPITFLPSYKYDVGSVGLFDSSEKQRAPSWCDRILYRTRKDKEEYQAKCREEEEAKKKDQEMMSRGLADDDDVLFSYDPDTDGDEPHGESSGFVEYDEYDEDMTGGAEGEPEHADAGAKDRISLDIYTSHQRITSSDHKPIISVFTLDYDAVVPELRAKVHAEVARELDRVENEGRADGGPVVTLGSLEISGGFTRATLPNAPMGGGFLTIANTGGVAASFSFVDTPGGEGFEDKAEWLTATFIKADGIDSEPLGKNVTLEPGETVLALVSGEVSSPSHVRLLNQGGAKIDDVLVLRVEGGRDHFIPVRGSWVPSCFGRSVDELIRVPDGGIRKFIHDWNIDGSIPYDAEQRFSAPKELFKVTAAMESLAERCVADEAMLEDVTLPKDLGWPLDASTWTADKATLDSLAATLVKALDADEQLIESLPIETPSAHKLEALGRILMLFLSSLTDGIVPPHVWAKLATAAPPPSTKAQILDVLSASPNHNVAFVFLTTTLSRTAAELSPAGAAPIPQPLSRRISFRRAPPPGSADQDVARRRAAREKRFAEIVAPVVCRAADAKDMVRAKAILEACVKREDDI